MIFNAYSSQKEPIGGILPISCGHIFAKSGREVHRPKGRKDWLLFYVAKENPIFYLERPETFSAGSFILFAPDEPQHHIYKGDKTAEYYYVHFQCKALPKELGFKTSHHYDLPLKPMVPEIFEELLEEMLQKAPAYESIASYSLLRLLAALARDATHQPKQGAAGFSRIAKAVQHMNRYYNSDLSLADYAALCHMSKHHFLRVFEEITGQTPLAYRNRIRMDHAAELILEENHTIEEIGDSLGFSSPAYFSAAFKKHFGLSPKQYQRKERKNADLA